jgi:peptidyl-prolyl cis-trans isomerase SurA
MMFRMNRFFSTIIMTCLVLFPLNSRAAVMLDKIVAVVNSEVITWSELYRDMEFELSRNMQSVTQEQKMDVFKRNESSYLEGMINKKLQLQEAQKKRINVGDMDIDNAVRTISEKYGLGESEFQKVIENEGFTVSKYREMLREQIIIGRLVEREVMGKINISEEEVERYVKERRLGTENLYRIRQIFIKVPEDGDEQAAWGKMSDIQKRLAEGEDFETLARTYSEDASADNGGDLGFLRKDNLSLEFQEALGSMSPGDISSPFSTRRGIHIIKLEDIKDVRAIIKDERFSQAYQQWLKGLRERSFIEIRL